MFGTRREDWPSAALCAILCLVTGSTRAAEAPRTDEEAYQLALRSTAWVQVYQDNKLRRMGTGFLVDRVRKLLITNQHVVDHQELVDVVFPLYQNGQVIIDKKNY